MRETEPRVSNGPDRGILSDLTRRQVRRNASGASAGRRTNVSNRLSSKRRQTLSDGESIENGRENRANGSSTKSTPAVSPRRRACGKKRSLRKVIESDGEEKSVENDDDYDDAEEQLLQKLEEIRRKRARRDER